VPRRLPNLILALCFLGMAFLGTLGVAGCGESHDLNVSEGEPVKLGQLTYNVQLSRFLNPGDSEDRYYLTGHGQLPPSKDYFGVFIQIKSSSDSAQPIPRSFTILDTQGNRYQPVASKSDFALDVGGRIDPHSSAPAPDTPAAAGPTEGALILYTVDNGITENRPLHLLIPGPGRQQAQVKLDI
jgi:hypothetical protein